MDSGYWTNGGVPIAPVDTSQIAPRLAAPGHAPSGLWLLAALLVAGGTCALALRRRRLA